MMGIAFILLDCGFTGAIVVAKGILDLVGVCGCDSSRSGIALVVSLLMSKLSNPSSLS